MHANARLSPATEQTAARPTQPTRGIDDLIQSVDKLVAALSVYTASNNALAASNKALADALSSVEDEEPPGPQEFMNGRAYSLD